MSSRYEELLQALLNGETADIVPRSRLEAALKNCIEGCGCDGLTEPKSRSEAYLQALAEKMKGGGGGGVDKIQRWIELNGNSASYLFDYFNGTSVDEFMDGVDTSNVTNMGNMFAHCSNLTTVPTLDTRNVTSMNGMFTNCKALTTVPLFDTRNVTEMGSMFGGCEKLTTVPSLDTSKVTNMTAMVTNCKALTTVPLFDTRNVKSISSMFGSCSNLTTVPALDFRNASSLSNIFSNCESLTECWVRNIRVAVQVGSDTSWGHLLTLESLLHLCKECRIGNRSYNVKLTVGTANLEKLANVYVKLIDITDDMRAEDDLIDDKYPFVQCQSTDEGAMTLQDYMALKKWSLA